MYYRSVVWSDMKPEHDCLSATSLHVLSRSVRDLKLSTLIRQVLL